MCELLGMSANVPTDIVFSLTGLIERGGRTGPHRDGWGIAFYEGNAVRLFRDPAPGAHSEVARFVQRYPIKSCIVLSHVRQANRGRVALENTHPFSRELWGRQWIMVHNGQLRGIKRLPLPFYRPVGTTDSEYAFCWMLGQIRARFPRPPRHPQTLWRFLQKLCAALGEYGVFNCLISDSRVLYAHCSNHLTWITRRAPFGPARLVDADMQVDFASVTTPDDVVTVVATRALTDNERWTSMRPSGFQVFRGGEALWPDASMPRPDA